MNIQPIELRYGKNVAYACCINDVYHNPVNQIVSMPWNVQGWSYNNVCGGDRLWH